MQAFEISGFGDVTVFKKSEIEKPIPGPGEILVRNMATSVNPLDTKIRQGLFKSILPELPAIIHGDSAGTVESIGTGIEGYKNGDKVFGYCGGFKEHPGALAEYSIFKEGWMCPMPENLSFNQAAALPLAAITAWMALMDKVSLRPDSSILIHGGTGGVGHLAVQLAKNLGMKVYTTVSTDEKARIAHELGADFVINYRNHLPEDYVKEFTDDLGFETVFDTVGGEVLKNSLESVRPGGNVLTIAARSQQDLTPLHIKGSSLHAIFMLAPMIYGSGYKLYSQILREIKSLVEKELLRPLLDKKIFSMDQVADAHSLLENGKATGKIVIEFS